MDPVGVASGMMRHSVLMKSVRVGAALVLSGALLVGCAAQGDPDPDPVVQADPTVAYCKAYDAYFERSIDPEATDAERIASMKTFARDLAGLELPEMDDEVAQGLEVWSALINDAPDDATEADMAGLEGDLTPAEAESIRAFLDWNTATC